jgi:hypothetical protein
MQKSGKLIILSFVTFSVLFFSAGVTYVLQTLLTKVDTEITNGSTAPQVIGETESEDNLQRVVDSLTAIRFV